MGIDRVQGFDPASGMQAAAERPRPGQSHAGRQAEGRTEAKVGTPSKQENPVPRNAPAARELPEDEVQVQRDPQIGNMIIIKYVDGSSGQLILQVPSEQVVNVARGIYEDLQQQTRSQSAKSANRVNEGGESHGH
ncbi:MAG: flagellar protein FlaG [Acidobacteriia bacterium]|nr:flagellar protein FlaG [Terriglobia bacterium]